MLAAEQRALPECVVGVLDRQRLERGRGPGAPRCIRDGEVVEQQRNGPPVRRAVMQDEQERVVIRIDAEERRAEGELGGEIEALGCRVRNIGVERCGSAGDLVKRRGKRCCRHDTLLWSLVALNQNCPQALVAQPHLV